MPTLCTKRKGWATRAAAARILELWTGSDRFGDSVTLPAGSSKIEPEVTPHKAVTLQWSTFTEAADEAGMSRRYGGIHFRGADLAGRLLGRMVALEAWEKAQTYFNGTALVASRGIGPAGKGRDASIIHPSTNDPGPLTAITDNSLRSVRMILSKKQGTRVGQPIPYTESPRSPNPAGPHPSTYSVESGVLTPSAE
jgi:hypothetical protein